MKKVLISLLAILLIIEERLWDMLTALGNALARLLHLSAFERRLIQASPPAALIAFAVPMLIVTPINLAAFWLLAHGRLLQGVLMEIAAKLLATLLVARVFALTRRQLLTFSAFALLYSTITGSLQWAHERIAETGIYRLARRTEARVKDRLETWFKQRPTQR